MFSLFGEKNVGQEKQTVDMEHLLQDDDIQKLERLQLINASARYELLAANQQLIDFHYNRVLFNKNKKKKGAIDTITEQVVEESARKVSFSDKAEAE